MASTRKLKKSVEQLEGAGGEQRKGYGKPGWLSVDFSEAQRLIFRWTAST